MGEARNSLREFGIPALAAFLFLLVESAGHLPELALTAFIICATLLMFAVRDNPGEPLLFFVGVVVGAFVEIGLRIFGYQQMWTSASLFGVPYWLPIAWGTGFVLITRLGLLIRRKNRTV
ncbi:MAG: hypothetical protein ACREGR_02090 [Minisyncoccia bacterium]